MEKVFCVNLGGGRDVECFLVDEEAYSWIVSGKKTGRGEESEWEDQDCPETVKNRIDGPVFVTIGSLDNDRAIQALDARLLIDDKETPCFGSERDAFAYAEKKGLEVVDTYCGCLY